MGILEDAKPTIVICTRDRARATAFYRDTLGLTLAYEDSFAAVFNIGGVTLLSPFAPNLCDLCLTRFSRCFSGQMELFELRAMNSMVTVRYSHTASQKRSPVRPIKTAGPT